VIEESFVNNTAALLEGVFSLPAAARRFDLWIRHVDR